MSRAEGAVGQEIEIRPARPGEGLPIAETKRASWQAAYRGILPDRFLDELRLVPTPEDWEVAIRAGRPPWVATDGERIVGIAAVGTARGEDLPTGTGELFMIYALPEVWGSGVGARLHEVAIEELRHQGFGQAILWVLDGNERAAAFYRRMGWEPDGATLDDDLGEVVFHEVRYRIDLGAPT